MHVHIDTFHAIINDKMYWNRRSQYMHCCGPPCRVFKQYDCNWIFIVGVLLILRFVRGSDDVDFASEEFGSASCLLFCLRPKMWVSPVNTLHPKLWAHVSFLSNSVCLNKFLLLLSTELRNRTEQTPQPREKETWYKNASFHQSNTSEKTSTQPENVESQMINLCADFLFANFYTRYYSLPV